MPMKFILAILGLSFLLCNITHAKEEDNYSDAVWVNLDIDYDNSNDDDQMYEYLSQRRCANAPRLGQLTNVSDSPLVDIDLVKSAFIINNASALTELGADLVKYKVFPDNDGFEQVHAYGLDGIIVYASKPKPRFMSLTTPRNYKHKIKTHFIKNVNNKASILAAFCKAIPHYTGIPK